MVEKYKAYPEYKNSGTRWMGDVPKDWSLIPLKYLCQFSGGGTPSKDSPEYWNGNIPWVSPKDMKTSRITSTIDNVTERAINESSTNLVDEGALLVVVRSGILQHSIPVAINDVPVTLNQDMKAIRFNARLNAQYAMYVTIGSQAALLLEWRKQGATVESIEQEYLANTVFPVPPVNEQDKITKFLDVETAKIDTLIEKQQQLIHLLKEKRQAVISHAVTKGLNPNAKMRDSGVEWLGEVPEHWKVSKFGYVSMVVRGGSPRPAGDPELFNGDYSPWVTVAEITKDGEVYLTETETFLTKKGSEQCRVFSSGTLLISNSGATLGVPKILSINANANDGVVGFENLKLDHEFSYFYLSTLTDDLRERIKQGSGQPNLNTDIVKNIAVPIPPKSEISEIVTLIRNTREQYANLTTRATAAIELLQERRTALISAAVTGKIDIRNWVAPKESQTNKEVAA
ncbi:restriction endonuclease [Pseudomonas lundensis]|uniref:Restriction endonuclease n=1 Tax=Pseudomonas lundensis TaxID=86185 RepID=A0A266N4H3_9PSED|nr:restriction endonuclease subunit S [Pseudomonas lundensis]OZY57398.1 restriction endonuclease [Pseudomonas lundensis]